MSFHCLLSFQGCCFFFSITFLPPPNPPTTTCSFCCIHWLVFALVLIFLQYEFQLLVVSESFQGFLDLTASVSYLLKRRLLIKKGLWLLSLSDCWLEKNLFRSVGLQLVGILVIRELGCEEHAEVSQHVADQLPGVNQKSGAQRMSSCRFGLWGALDASSWGGLTVGVVLWWRYLGNR